MSTIIHTHFRQAREESGQSQAVVAEVLGVPRSAISRIESGERRLSATEARAAARLFGVEVGWLLAEPAAEPVDRADVRGTVEECHRATVAAEVERGIALCRALDLLDPARRAGGRRARGAGPEPETPFLAHLVGHRAALDERARLQLGRAGQAPLGSILDGMGITVATAPLPEGLSGLAVPGEDVILLAVDESAGRQRFTLARQYGALYLADASPLRRTAARAELWAACLDTFAATLLLPREALDEALAGSAPSETAAGAARMLQLARRWGVSATFVVKAARGAGLLDKAAADTLTQFLHDHGSTLAHALGLGPKAACDDLNASRQRLRTLVLGRLAAGEPLAPEVEELARRADPTLDMQALQALAGGTSPCA